MVLLLQKFFTFQFFGLSVHFYLKSLQVIWQIDGGRKKTMILGTVIMLVQWVVLFYAHGFVQLAIATLLFGISFACLSGTDEALVYDTERELDKESSTLTKLGRLRSGRGMFKIITPVVGAFLAKDLIEGQFQLLITIDFIAAFIALILTIRLTEPHHRMDVEKVEAGVMKDAFNMLGKDPQLLRAILNKEIVFIAFFILWSYYQQFFVDLGLSILLIGIGWSLMQLTLFTWNWYVGNFHKEKSVAARINRLNIWFTFFSLVTVSFLFSLPVPIVIFGFFLLMTLTEAFRFPLFSELFNKRFHSYNRATTLSLTNFLHSILELPIVLYAAYLVSMDTRFPFIMTFGLGLLVILFLQIRQSVHSNK